MRTAKKGRKEWRELSVTAAGPGDLTTRTFIWKLIVPTLLSRPGATAAPFRTYYWHQRRLPEHSGRIAVSHAPAYASILLALSGMGFSLDVIGQGIE